MEQQRSYQAADQLKWKKSHIVEATNLATKFRITKTTK